MSTWMIGLAATLVQGVGGLEWAEVLDARPSAAVVTDVELRAALEATGLPWRVRDRASGIELLLVPGGKFVRGAADGDEDAEESERPAREVELAEPFYLSRYEVTWAQWREGMGFNPMLFQPDPQQPVWNVSYEDAQRFCAKYELRLPSEAEWERACRAGDLGVRYADLDACAWYFANSGKEPLDAATDWDLEKVRGEWRCRAQLVGKKRANALGFHDMLGNVDEWCSDWFAAGEYARDGAALASPRGPESGTVRVVRGGTWEGPPWNCRASYRDYANPTERDEGTGLRVARDVRSRPRIAPPPVRSEAVEPWGEVLELAPDPRVVTDAELRSAIEQSALPWRVKDKATGVELLLVPAGSYLRGGSGVDPQAAANERPQHSVVISAPFYLGRYELTQAQWELAMGENPSKKARNPQAPVDSVSFDDTLALRARTGLRVPTEGEWEFACRAGTLGARYGPLDDIAWYAANSDLTTHEVGGKRPNALGFHDMIGNVYEWCSDWYSAEEHQRCAAGVRDPVGPESGKHRMLRGGSCHYDPEICRVSRRGTYLPAGRFDDFGVRVARTPGVDLPPLRDAQR